MNSGALSLVVATLLSLPGLASAQRGDSGRVAPVGTAPRAGRAARALQQPGAAGAPALQREVRQAFARVVRRQLNLNDAQMQSLQRVDLTYDQQRRDILRGERETRIGLKAAMQDSVGPNQDKIAQYVAQLVQVQHKRAELLDSEQKELAAFLTPMQRAQYLALKERMAKRLQDLQQQNNGGGRRGRGAASQPVSPER